MESNKPLSVHMTHEEYENYKKYLELAKDKTNLLFSCTKKIYDEENTIVSYQIYSLREVKLIAGDDWNQKIKQIETEKDSLQHEIYNHKVLIMQLEEDIKQKQVEILKLKEFIIKEAKRATISSWWRSLWN